ncbi:hypothetical protein NL676_039479 [Syzygium grande]|nr:hypothetical protein NL676_039479 [Syzygium grande]
MHAYSDANEVRYEHGSTRTATFPTRAGEPTSHLPRIRANFAESRLFKCHFCYIFATRPPLQNATQPQPSGCRHDGERG